MTTNPLPSRWPAVCGIIAGPLLMLVLLVDGATRPGYDQWRHGVSQLTSGDGGWLPRAVFIICGLLVLAFTIAVSRSMPEGFGHKWGPRFTAAIGTGLIVAGVFPTDPALGYPPGAAAHISISGGLHQLGGTLLFAGLIGAPIVWARRFRREQQPAWASYCIYTSVLVAGFAFAAGIVYRLMTKDIISTGGAGLLELLAFAAGFTWLTAIAAKMHQAQRPSTSRRGD